MLEGANIKLSGTISNINGKSARNIIDTILSGIVIDSSKYDEMYDNKVISHNLKASKAAKPEADRKTWVLGGPKADAPLADAGLYGPVTLKVVK